MGRLQLVQMADVAARSDLFRRMRALYRSSLRPESALSLAAAPCFHHRFTDPNDAKQVLKMGIEDQPDGGIHLGVTPLGVAFAVCAGWTVGEGEKRGVPFKLQGSTAFVHEVAPMLREQLQAQGLEAGTWQLPLFCCDELESPNVLPVFLSRADLVETWVASGRKREDLPENLTVMDLRILVKQMQTDSFAWSTVQFVGSSLAVEASCH